MSLAGSGEGLGWAMGMGDAATAPGAMWSSGYVKPLATARGAMWSSGYAKPCSGEDGTSLDRALTIPHASVAMDRDNRVVLLRCPRSLRDRLYAIHCREPDDERGRPIHGVHIVVRGERRAHAACVSHECMSGDWPRGGDCTFTMGRNGGVT